MRSENKCTISISPDNSAVIRIYQRLSKLKGKSFNKSWNSSLMGDNFKTQNISSHQFNYNLDGEKFLDEIGRIKQLQPTVQICSTLSSLHEQCLQPVQPMNQELKRYYTKTVIRTHIFTPRIIRILHFAHLQARNSILHQFPYLTDPVSNTGASLSI